MVTPAAYLIMSAEGQSGTLRGMAETTATAEQQARKPSDRDRFVAFSFCWAEAILELDAERRIVFAGGILPILTGKDTRALRGMRMLDVIADEDRPLAEQML